VLISYYQWVPLILLFQAMLAFVPCLVWRFVNKRSGVNMAAIMDAARHSSQAHYLEIREKVRLAIELSQFGPAVAYPLYCMSAYAIETERVFYAFSLSMKSRVFKNRRILVSKLIGHKCKMS